MNNWKKVKLGSILTESKIEAVESNADSRIRVLLNANGVIKRPLTKETKGATKYFKRSEGQFIYGKQNLHKGAFGIIPKELDGFTSSSDLPAFDVDKSCLPEWLDYFLKQGDFYLSLIDIAKGAATKRIQPKALFEVEIPLPDTTQEQQEIIEGFKNKERYNELLDSEIQTQKQLISQLKQAILQEAIQGKLTQEWREQYPNTEPASELLKRIKAEKEKLIKDKKIKKEKPLPPITAEEIPFTIPESWSWCRLGEISDIQRGSSPRPKGDKRYFSEEKTNSNWITISDITNNSEQDILLKTKEYLTDLGTKYSRYVNKNEFIIAVSGSTTGKCCLTGIKGFIYDGLAVVRLHNKELYPQFLLNYMIQLYTHINNSKEGASFPNINTGFLKNMVYPLMSLEEQKAIVEKVVTLMQKCNALEQEITQSEQYANMLMQAVLKEAFERETIV
ncbi:restriction endonuclease subunit S [Winogradskyella pulchriflava]|uniref:Restriction endonuclease subunit S n=1 Tax=Winogradskyella pulchriflava TaxID=1110688 RepID=A0ABV6QAR3_9FLAO